jgi:hypothetical protein
MTEPEIDPDKIDGSLTTWEGSRREQMRRWAEASLEEIILSLEELEAVSDAFSSGAQSDYGPQRSAGIASSWSDQPSDDEGVRRALPRTGHET